MREDGELSLILQYPRHTISFHCIWIFYKRRLSMASQVVRIPDLRENNSVDIDYSFMMVVFVKTQRVENRDFFYPRSLIP